MTGGFFSRLVKKPDRTTITKEEKDEKVFDLGPVSRHGSLSEQKGKERGV